MAPGILILSKGRYVKIGLTARVLFNLFLAQLVLGWPEIQRPGSDFLLNRLPNLLFAPPAVPALLGPFRHEPSRTSARSPALARPTCKSSSGLWPNSSE